MSTPLNFISFVGAASVTVNAPSNSAQTFALPAVDAGNTAMTIRNNSNGTAFIGIGTLATGMNPAGITVNSGVTTLLLNQNQGTATYASILLAGSGGSLTFTRGTATSVTAFTTHDD
jgi:hypothetical protein